MLHSQNIDDLVEEMKGVGDILVPYNWPQNDPKLENDLNSLKTRFAEIDGYNLVVHFSRADYKTHYLETLQVMGEKAPFLPFCVVARLGRKFLGSHHLYLVELIKDNRKIYCWTVHLDKTGRPIPPIHKQKTQYCEYDGFSYYYLNTNQVNFY